MSAYMFLLLSSSASSPLCPCSALLCLSVQRTAAAVDLTDNPAKRRATEDDSPVITKMIHTVESDDESTPISYPPTSLIPSPVPHPGAEMIESSSDEDEDKDIVLREEASHSPHPNGRNGSHKARSGSAQRGRGGELRVLTHTWEKQMAIINGTDNQNHAAESTANGRPSRKAKVEGLNKLSGMALALKY